MAHKFVYQPLYGGHGTIRLLDVDLSGQGQHKLVAHAPMRTSNYLALSYPWGSAQNKTNISVNGAMFAVSQNLREALESARRYWNETYARREVLLLWADQICINQADDAEKNQQVAMMGDIYQCSQRALIWLPVPRTVTSSPTSWATWQKWHRQHIEPSSQAALVTMQPPALSDMMEHDYTVRREYPADTDRSRRERDTMVAWEHILDIVNSVWWGRAWVYQEIMGPDQATFLIGSVSASWQDLRELLQLYFNQRRRQGVFCTELLKKNTAQSSGGFQVRLPRCCGGCLDCCQSGTAECAEMSWKSGDDWDGGCPEVWRCIARTCDCCGSILRRCDMDPATDPSTQRDRRSFIREHGKKLMDSEAAWKLANFVLESKVAKSAPSAPPYLPLLDLMMHSRNCGATNPRDKIYAFLGLAEPGHGIQVDYSETNTRNAVLVEAARAIITRRKRLDILATAQENGTHGDSTGNDPLPSWVPDWSVPDTANTAYRVFLRAIRLPMGGQAYGELGDGAVSAASLDEEAVVSFPLDGYGRPGRVMRTRAIRAARLVRAKAPGVDSGSRVGGPSAAYSRFAGDLNEEEEILTVPEAQVGDQVWVLLGADETYTLRPLQQGGGTPARYVILGHAMIKERDPMTRDVLRGTAAQRVDASRRTRFIRDGGLVEKWRRGECYHEDILIV